MRIVYQTRFSYLGLSGWKSAASADPALLYDDARLARRFALFERLTLPSLAAQTDGDFCHMVLAGLGMPEPWRRRLRDVCLDTLGSDRATVQFRRPGSAATRFRRMARQRCRHAARVAQVVLDDDDALACDFTETLRAEALHACSRLDPGTDHVYLSFATGLTLYWQDGHPAPELAWRNVPFTNLGLTLVAPPDSREQPFATSHRRIGERHPSRLIAGTRPWYLRTVHGDNDSRAICGPDRLEPALQARLLERFPFLPPLLAARPAALASAAPGA